MQDTSIRVDRITHAAIKELAAELGTSVGNTVALAIRRLRQERLGSDLSQTLTEDESAWLDAELG